MRTCCRCQEEMIEGFDVRVEGGAYGIKIASGMGVFASRIGRPKVAICPNCGEISMYIENVDKISPKK